MKQPDSPQQPVSLDRIQSIAELRQVIAAFGHQPGRTTEVKLTPNPAEHRIELQGRSNQVFTAYDRTPGDLAQSWKLLRKTHFPHHPALRAPQLETETPPQLCTPASHIAITRCDFETGELTFENPGPEFPCCLAESVNIDGVTVEREPLPYSTATWNAADAGGNSYWQPAQQVRLHNCSELSIDDLADASIEFDRLQLKTNSPAAQRLQQNTQDAVEKAVAAGLAPAPPEPGARVRRSALYQLSKGHPDQIILVSPRAQMVEIDSRQQRESPLPCSLIQALYYSDQPLVPVHPAPPLGSETKPEVPTEIIEISLEYQEIPGQTDPNARIRPARDIILKFRAEPPGGDLDLPPGPEQQIACDLAASPGMPYLGAVYNPDKLDRERLAQFLLEVSYAEEYDNDENDDYYRALQQEIEERIAADLDGLDQGARINLQRQLDQLDVGIPENRSKITLTKVGPPTPANRTPENPWRLTLTYEPL